jgi:TolB-like protein/DNA-binding SARP family transcriptional activator
MDRSPNPLRIRLLGGFELASGCGRDVPLPGRKIRALMACLALSPGKPWPREKLMALLWSDRGEEQARASLRQALAELRRALGEPSPLRTEHDAVSLDPAMIAVDAAEFEWLAEAGKSGEAAMLYRGPLLDSHGVRDDAFEDWLRAERTRLRDLAIDALDRLTASQSGNPAIETAQRLLQLDPAREETHRTLMRLYIAAGQRAQALRQYQQCCDTLQRELQARPDVETERLYRQIQDEAKHAPATSPGPVTPDPASLADAKPSIAILPFENLSGDPEQRYFSDGITEDIITELSRNHGLFVIARNSSFQYRDRAIDVKRIGHELGVHYVVEGSVRKMGSHVRIAVQLIDTGTGNHLWAERYDRELQAIFAIQDEVTTAIVAAVAGQVQAAAIGKVRRKRTGSLAAYDYFLRGLAHVVRFGGDDIFPARDMFARAIEIDPDFAQAHTFLAWSLVEIFWTEWGKNSRATIDHALLAAQKAVTLDGNDAMCHATLVYVYIARKSFDLAAHHVDIATRLNPNDSEIIMHRGMLEVYTGRFQEALRTIEVAMRLNPTPPNYYWVLQGIALYHLQRYEEAGSAFQRATARPPYVDRYLAACYAQLGRFAEARVLVTKTLAQQPDFSLSEWAATEPYQYRANLDDLLDGLRKAGLPE